MSTKEEVIAILGPASVREHGGKYWTVYQGHQELGFGLSEEDAWLNALGRYKERLSVVDRAFTFNPKHTNH